MSAALQQHKDNSASVEPTGCKREREAIHNPSEGLNRINLISLLAEVQLSAEIVHEDEPYRKTCPQDDLWQ